VLYFAGLFFSQGSSSNLLLNGREPLVHIAYNYSRGRHNISRAWVGVAPSVVIVTITTVKTSASTESRLIRCGWAVQATPK
jgi:hypothetical protein